MHAQLWRTFPCRIHDWMTFRLYCGCSWRQYSSNRSRFLGPVRRGVLLLGADVLAVPVASVRACALPSPITPSLLSPPTSSRRSTLLGGAAGGVALPSLLTADVCAGAPRAVSLAVHDRLLRSLLRLGLFVPRRRHATSHLWVLAWTVTRRVVTRLRQNSSFGTWLAVETCIFTSLHHWEAHACSVCVADCLCAEHGTYMRVKASRSAPLSCRTSHYVPHMSPCWLRTRTLAAVHTIACVIWRMGRD